MESDYTLWRLSLMASGIGWEKYNFESLCDMHRYIFQDVFDWAGKPRIINIEKEEAVLGDISIEYSDCFDIAGDARNVLQEMNQYPWDEVSFENVVTSFGDFLARLWKAHPFREGNTRTIVTFCSMFIESKGIYIESDLFKDHAVYMRNALVAATAMFHDLGDLRKQEYLYRIIGDALEQGKEMKDKISELLGQAEVLVSKKNIREVILWNRRTDKEHTSEEIKNYLEG
ncbi:MAG: Fic family protein [Clostridiales bacterium]|nr:Fic family protein [Clostridiales bacterium]